MKNRIKLWDWAVWNQRFKWKSIEYFMPSKKYIYFFWYNIKVKNYWVFCNIKKKKYSWYNIKMLEITIDNCHKGDIETMNDPNNSQYF